MKKLALITLLTVIGINLLNVAPVDATGTKKKKKISPAIKKLLKAKLPKKKYVTVSVKTILGQDLTGKVLVGHKKHHWCKIKIDKKTVKQFSWHDVRKYEIKLGGEDIKGYKKQFIVANWLAKKKCLYPAYVLFKKAAKAKPKLIPHIQKILKRNKVKIPKSLGGEAEEAFFERNCLLNTYEQALQNHALAKKWGGIMKEIAPKTRRFETTHFIIYTNYDKKTDKKLIKILNQLYGALAKMLSIPIHEHIWVGKLPIYMFNTKAKYREFGTKVTGGPSQAAGYQMRSGIVNYVVMGPGYDRKKMGIGFWSTLVHETSHAFNARYQTSRYIPNWIDEGMSELFSTKLVPARNAGSGYSMQLAHQAIKNGRYPDIKKLYKGKRFPLDVLYYGYAQSVVRFLIKKDVKKFLELYKLYKKGVKNEDALQQVYEWSFEDLQNAWLKSHGITAK